MSTWPGLGQGWARMNSGNRNSIQTSLEGDRGLTIEPPKGFISRKLGLELKLKLEPRYSNVARPNAHPYSFLYERLEHWCILISEAREEAIGSGTSPPGMSRGSAQQGRPSPLTPADQQSRVLSQSHPGLHLPPRGSPRYLLAVNNSSTNHHRRL